MESSYWERLRPALQAKGWSLQQLADNLGVSFQAVAKVRKGGAFGSSNNIKAAKVLGLNPEWLATGRGQREATDVLLRQVNSHMTPAVGVVAQTVSPSVFILPVRLTWDALMQSEDLPERFVLEAPDDALAPNLPRGTPVVFAKTSHARPGECVLVQDSRGQRYIRRFVQGVGGAFSAQALHDAYVSLDSARDGLRVLAVMEWRAERMV